MKKLRLLIGMLALSAGSLFAQTNLDATQVKTILETKNYVFKALTATPTQGRFRQLTPEYDLTVSGDSVISFLPYFGRAYTAPINPSDGGIKFTSIKSTYKIAKGKKNRWDIIINPKDVSEVQDLYLTVYENGRATLRVNSLNRSSISFDGYLVEGTATRKAF